MAMTSPPDAPPPLRRLEARVLLVVLAGAGAIWGFFNLASEVMEGDTLALDRRLLLMLRDPTHLGDPIGPRWLEEAMRDLTALGGFTVLTLVTLAGILLFSLHGKRRQAWILGVTVLVAQVSAEAFKALYDRPRPALAPHGDYVYSQSFPSGHATLAAAVFLTLATLIASLESRPGAKRLIYGLAVTVTIAVGISRVYLGVHWPSDVLAGWSLGAAWALGAWLVLEHPRRRGGASEASS